jgi:hypothetical protein
MDDDENKPGTTQIPLLHDILFDASLPLRPPPKPAAQKNKINYSPGYDPDTIDLFEDGNNIADQAPGDSIADELKESTGPVVADASNEIDHRLRGELADQLESIVEDLNHATDKDQDKAP